MAFVPNPLPPALERPGFLGRIADELILATRGLSLLDGNARSLLNPHLLLFPLLLREAKLSSKIENTIASAEEVVLAAAGRMPEASEAQEVLNYIKSMQHGVDSPLPVCGRLVRDMHRILMRDVRGGNKQPGKFRDIQVYIGGIGTGLEGARFVPPPPGPSLLECMEHFDKFVNRLDPVFPELVGVAMAHYQFECIHPFRDGNGRIGRAVAALSLCKTPRPLLSRPFVYLSGYFDKHRQEYYDRLLRVSTHGDWEGWVRFFLNAVAAEADDAMRRILSVLELRAGFVALVTVPRASSLLPKLIDEFFRQPAMTTAQAAEALGIRPQAAQRHIDRLVELGIIVQNNANSWGRVWIVRKLLDVIEADAPPSAPDRPGRRRVSRPSRPSRTSTAS